MYNTFHCVRHVPRNSSPRSAFLMVQASMYAFTTFQFLTDHVTTLHDHEYLDTIANILKPFMVQPFN